MTFTNGDSAQLEVNATLKVIPDANDQPNYFKKDFFHADNERLPPTVTSMKYNHMILDILVVHFEN